MSNPTTDKGEELTDMEKAFLDALQAEGNKFDPRKAATAAGYSPKTTLYHIIKPISKEVQKIADAYMTVNTLKASASIIDVLDNPTQLGAPNMIKAAESLLDRAGLSKKNREEEQVAQYRAVILLPPKLED
jgi:hypothetical protein